MVVYTRKTHGSTQDLAGEFDEITISTSAGRFSLVVRGGFLVLCNDTGKSYRCVSVNETMVKVE